MSKKPAENAKELFNNCLYFTGGKMMARECALFICQKLIEQTKRMDDKCHTLDTIEELYKIDITK